MLYKFEANIRLAPSKYQKVMVVADNSDKAKLMLESQYGKGNVSNVINKGKA